MTKKIVEYNRIKVVLAEKKKTSKELAAYLKVTPEAVSRWCNNKNQPSIPTLYSIAKYLQVKVSSLLIEN